MARGGKREGAGRKKGFVRTHDSPHRARPDLDARHPVHVVLRMKQRYPELRTRKYFMAIRRAMFVRPDFRICHITIQQNHLHLIVEAKSREALTSGMHSFAIRAAHAIQRAWGCGGTVWAHRYHATQITTPRQARSTLAYVLNNWRHHRADARWNGRPLVAKVDKYSSAVSFTGWIGGAFTMPSWYVPLPVSPPQTALLRTDWRRHGLLDPWEIPGQFRGRLT